MLFTSASAVLLNILQIKGDYDICGFTIGMSEEELEDRLVQLTNENIDVSYQEVDGGIVQQYYRFELFDDFSMCDLNVSIGVVDGYVVFVGCLYPVLSREAMKNCAEVDLKEIYKKAIRIFGEEPEVYEWWKKGAKEIYKFRIFNIR